MGPSAENEAIKALREAVAVSPDNAPLRRHLADSLLKVGHPGDAEQEYRQALAIAPADQPTKLGLATAFSRQGKYGEALVVVESLLTEPAPMPSAYLLHARLLVRTGEQTRAAQQYRRALEFDLGLADPELATELGLSATRESLPRPLAEYAHGETEPATGSLSEETVDLVPTERSGITFADIGGMEELKEEIRLKIVHPLTHPEIYQAYGKPIGGGILLYGPPGCGKTHLARATAGEIGADFLLVGIADVLDMWLGNSERNLRELFAQARRRSPCVLFFDEVDALGASRSELRHGAGRNVVNQFLVEMDGMHASNEGVLVLGATNAPWHLDAAFRRPGRFGQVLFVPPPDRPARVEILRLMLRGKPVEDVDVERLVGQAEGFSGADLKGVVDAAVERKLRAALRTGLPTPLSTKDLFTALKKSRPTTAEWFATARNYALYANQGGDYDDILLHLNLKRSP